MGKIAWDNVPEWARQLIRQTEKTHMVSNRENDMVVVSGGIARFNGIEVAQEGEAVFELDAEQTIELWRLPDWAQRKVLHDNKIRYMLVGANLLHFSPTGEAWFNGARVLTFRK